ncbi:MAG: GNAT family N-acetyltransferase [Phycisphaerae bacterium]
MAEITIRSMRPEDRDEVVAIAQSLTPWFSESGIAHIRIDVKFQAGLVAELDGRIVGFVTYYVADGAGNIGWIGLRQELLRRGIGRRLVQALVDELRTAGVEELHVRTLGESVNYAPYARTRAFYHAMGFVDSKSTFQDNPECPELLELVRQL